MGIFELPEGYSEIKRVNLQKDVKLAVLINAGAIFLMVLLYILGNMLVPFDFEINNDNLALTFGTLIGLLIAMVLYFTAHELVHGVFIKKYSGKKARYGFTGLYAYAASKAYFNKRQYIVIALAPVILFGVIFLLLNILLPKEHFWIIYLLQIINISGAAGDFYVTCLMGRLPADILVNDEGVTMVMYSTPSASLPPL